MAGFQNDPGTTQQEAGFGFYGDRFWTESAADALVARAGGGRASATKITSMLNRVATVATVNDSVVLPPVGVFPGGALIICVINDANNAMLVFADSSDTINGVAGATGVQQMGKSIVYYQCSKAATWQAVGLGTGYAGNQTTYSSADGLTAFATGGQASGTPITTSTARFTTVATAGDSATLPVAIAGMVLTVINAGANIMNLFPGVGDTINSLAINSALALPAGAVVDLYTTVAGTWHAIVASTGGAQQVYNVNSATAGTTLTGANITGGSAEVFLDLTGTIGGAANAQLPTVSALVTAMTVAGINPQPGMSYILEVCERSAAQTWTVTTNTGWTLTGTMTLGASGVTRRFIVTLTTLSAAVLRSLGTYTLTAS